MTGHVHAPDWDPDYWHDDIEMWTSKKQPKERAHLLLLGDPDHSYRWHTARMRLRSDTMGRTAHHKMFRTLKDFIAKLI